VDCITHINAALLSGPGSVLSCTFAVKRWNLTVLKRRVARCLVRLEFAGGLTSSVETNCYFTHDSSGFSVLLRFFDAQFKSP